MQYIIRKVSRPHSKTEYVSIEKVLEKGTPYKKAVIDCSMLVPLDVIIQYVKDNKVNYRPLKINPRKLTRTVLKEQ